MTDAVEVSIIGGAFTVICVLITRLTTKVDGQLKKQDELNKVVLDLSKEIATERGIKQGVAEERERTGHQEQVSTAPDKTPVLGKPG